MSLTCKQMLIVNDLFYKRSSLFLYEHISGLSSALLNHLHKGNWSWEYYSHVRPHHSVRKARRHNWVRGTFKCNCSCMQGNPGLHNFMPTISHSRVNISPPNGTEDGSNVTLLLPVQNVLESLFRSCWTLDESVITPRSSVRIPCCTCG